MVIIMLIEWEEEWMENASLIDCMGATSADINLLWLQAIKWLYLQDINWFWLHWQVLVFVLKILFGCPALEEFWIQCVKELHQYKHDEFSADIRCSTRSMAERIKRLLIAARQVENGLKGTDVETGWVNEQSLSELKAAKCECRDTEGVVAERIKRLQLQKDRWMSERWVN